MTTVWIEAESFENLGGWVVDPQSMGQMGAAYIMAHGMGNPVPDAETTCNIPASGTYTVWARTRDWTAVWKRGKPAGIFQVKVNGITLPEILGTNGEKWAWQKAGTIEIDQGEVGIALHDLSGFNGRCDALYLTTDPSDIPENDPSKLAEYRKQVTKQLCQDDSNDYDLAVAGGGVAAVCTAISAMRLGLKVVLIQDRPVLGGCNSSEIRVGLGGFAHCDPYPNLGNVVTEIEPVMGGSGTYPEEFYEDARKQNIFSLNNNDQCKLVLNERVVALEKDPQDEGKITALISRHTHTGSETRYKARFFADCTGDATLARMMGNEVMYGRESRSDYNESLAPEKGDNQVMGHSVLWYSKKDKEPTSFPDIDWGVEFNEDNCYYIRGGDWEWETGQYRDQVEEIEYIRDYGLMVLFANWSYLKNNSKRKDEWANDTLDWVSSIGGKRESYRVVGDYVLSQYDIENNISHSDATGGMSWNIDLHFPDPENEAKFDEPFRSCAYHRGIDAAYPIPYRCLYARDIKNLFLGGRHISLTHVAFSCVRVMRTLGVLGEVTGMAASICAKENVYPRDIYEKHFEQLKELMKQGVPVPTYHAYSLGYSEDYHFKDVGFFSALPNESNMNLFDDKELKQRVQSLNIQHKTKHPGLEE